MNLDYVLNRRFEPTIQSYDARDSALYALSLSIGDDPLDEDELPYVYEGREPRAVPSQCVTLGWPPFWHEEPAAQISWRRILHGEQSFVLHRPLPLQGTIRADHSILAIEDKGVGRGALIHFATELSDRQTGEPLASLRSLQFLRDDGGCGAYGAMAAYAHFALSPLVGIPVGIVVSVAIAAVIGVPTLRLSGHYFSMATIAVAELARLIVTNTDYLGAGVGLSGPTVPRNLFDLSFISALPYYYLFLAILIATLGVTWWMADSRMGFYLRAIKDSERAARSLGAPASRVKLYAFMLSAGLTSVAGALYAMMFGFVDPDSGLGILISVKILIMAALGGAGLLFGPLVGAAILVPLEEISNNLLGGRGAGLTFVAYGAIIVLIARFQPGGILTLIKRRWATRGKNPVTSVAAGAIRAP